MYICPVCQKEFSTEEKIVKHLSVCWKENNPNHQSKEAPKSESIEIREIEDGVLDFFNSFQKR